MKEKNLKYLLYEILESSDKRKGFIYIIDDYLITGLIFLNVVAIILESYHEIYIEYKDFFRYFEAFSVIVFSTEYLLRLWVANIKFPNLNPITSRLKYIFSFMGLIDLVAILPFYLPRFIKIDLRILRALRLVRLFKLAYYSSSLRLIGRVLKNEKDQLITTVFATFIMVLLTSSVMYHVEHEVQPDKFPNIFATFWWAIATLTTIGYGDVYPLTGWGQLLAAVTALFGIGLVAIPTGIISMGFVDELNKRKAVEKEDNIKNKKSGHDSRHDNLNKEYNYCPYCGEKLTGDD